MILSLDFRDCTCFPAGEAVRNHSSSFDRNPGVEVAGSAEVGEDKGSDGYMVRWEGAGLACRTYHGDQNPGRALDLSCTRDFHSG